MSKSKTTTRQSQTSLHKSISNEVQRLNDYGFVVMPLEGKRPILKNWNHLQKTPERLFVFQNRNIGVLTGNISGITVLDIDVKNNGLGTWEHLSMSYPIFKTPMVKTPSGGLHLYFRYNKKIHSFSKFHLRGSTIGWDLLNNDRQVVAPPSFIDTPSKNYKWVITPEETDFIHMPQWLENYLLHCKSFS